MSFNPYFSFVETQRCGLRPRKAPEAGLRGQLYQDMLRKPSVDPWTYAERTIHLDDLILQCRDFFKGGIFNLDFSPEIGRAHV